MARGLRPVQGIFKFMNSKGIVHMFRDLQERVSVARPENSTHGAAAAASVVDELEL
jgi:hypothetical protein